MTGGQNYETGNLNTVESYPPTCSIPPLPTGTFYPSAMHLFLFSEVWAYNLSSRNVTPNNCGLWWVWRGRRSLLE